MMPGGIGARGEFAFHRCLGQHLHLADQERDGAHHSDERGDQLVVIGTTADLLQGRQFFGEVAGSDQFHDPYGILYPRLRLVSGAA
jgi:hypothetical protein